MGGGGGSSSTTTYAYRIKLPHQNIDPNSNIYAYDSNGVLAYTIGPNDPRMDYGKGIYTVPGSAQNLTVEGLSTATYNVSYSTDAVKIDYDNIVFKISNTILPNPLENTIWATFQYWAVYTAQEGVMALVDGSWETQLQTVFYAEPPQGYVYSVIDFGRVIPVQAIDIVAGFFKPDNILEFDIDFRFSLEYSLDGVDYYEVGDKTNNVQLTGGQSVSFEEDALGVGFETRYFRIVLENVKKINYSNEKITINESNRQSLIDAGIIEESKAIIGDVLTLREGLYAIAFTEISAYSDMILTSEAKLIPVTTLTANVDAGDGIIHVESTAGFTEPGSGQEAIAYLGKSQNKPFTYTGLTATSFTGVTVESAVAASAGAFVTQEIESDLTLYDDQGLLPKLGDRIYKESKINDKDLYTEGQLDYVAKSYLEEFYKNHNKLNVDVIYSPYLKVGQTVSVTDAYNGLSSDLFFIESIANNNGNYSLTLARYP